MALTINVTHVEVINEANISINISGAKSIENIKEDIDYVDLDNPMFSKEFKQLLVEIQQKLNK